MIIYDCEIKKAILGKNEQPIEGIEYCDGWRDFENMGISCVGAYDYNDNRYRVFMEDNLEEFGILLDDHDVIVGFNSIAFDNKLMEANGIDIPNEVSYDILVEIWAAAGLGPEFEYPSHIGFGLDACCETNFRLRKSGHGAHAPVDYQRGNYGALVDYCLNDIFLTRLLLEQIILGRIKDPRDPKNILLPNPPQMLQP